MPNFYLVAPMMLLLAACPLAHPQSSPSSSGGGEQPTVDCASEADAALPGCQQYPADFYRRNAAPRSGVPGSGSIYQDNGGAARVPAPAAFSGPPQPPEPLTEFQKLIAATTEQVLPIFGQDLFRGVPSPFAPVDQLPVTADYVLGPGDELRVRAWGQLNVSDDLTVDRSGDVYIPQVGRVHVAGLPFSDLSPHIRSAIGRVYRNFDLTVDLGQLRSIQIFVVGQARRPGAYTVSSLSTLVNALFASGGPSIQGTMRDIQLKREGAVLSHFDLYDLLLRGDKSKDVRLLPGDVIFIPAVGGQVALTGSVRRPAIYELKTGELKTGELKTGELKTGELNSASSNSIQQALDAAGGLSAIASGSRVSIERIEGRQTREAIEVPLDAAGLATAVRDGDWIRVLSIVPAFEKTVTLRGNLANPGRFAWHPGMKLSDLIPDRPSLLTRNYWWRRAELGLPGAEFEPLDGRIPTGQPTGPAYLSAASSPATENPGLLNQQQPAPQDRSAGNSGPSKGMPQSAQMPQSAETETSGGTLAGQQGNILTQNVAAAWEKTDISLSAPEIDWAYAAIERMNPDTLKTSLLSFNLGKLVIDHDPTQDLPLQPGDVVTIFSQADIKVPVEQQTKFVRLEGEFIGAGVYSVAPGETLRQLVQRAGGFSPDAYLFGSEFTRESTRVFQQQRLDEYVQSLELQFQRSTIKLAAASSAQEAGPSPNSANLSQQGLLSRLHQLRATGRIVLDVKPASVGVESIPDLALQDGDRFVVPSRPATVNVVGSVYDQNSFIFRVDGRVGDYLRLAGGPNREADKRHIFIIRADGSVSSRESANGLWGNNFEAIRLNPGDSIIVPEKIVGPSFVKNFINWSQVFSQLALGAAAINVL